MVYVFQIVETISMKTPSLENAQFAIPLVSNAQDLMILIATLVNPINFYLILLALTHVLLVLLFNQTQISVSGAISHVNLALIQLNLDVPNVKMDYLEMISTNYVFLNV
jgi:hypothetical protein